MIFRYKDAPDPRGQAVLVIDTLRATTTMTTILAHGAVGIRAVAALADAYRLKAESPEVLLGGERENRPPEGFDGGNSPYDYPRERVAGKRVVFSTTNGTHAIEHVEAADRIGLAALVNRAAAARWLSRWDSPWLIVAAGSEGQIALEDVLAAGAIVDMLPETRWGDGAKIAQATYHRYRDDLLSGLYAASHGQALIQSGLTRDLEFCAQIDIFDLVPMLNDEGWFIPR